MAGDDVRALQAAEDRREPGGVGMGRLVFIETKGGNCR